MARIPQITLKTAPVEGAVYNHIDYKPQFGDLSILERGNNMIREQEQALAEKMSAYDEQVAKIKLQLHQDPETLNRFDEITNNYKKQIIDSAGLLDPSLAVRVGTRVAGELTNNTETLGMLATNAQYQKEYETQKQRIGKGISQETFNWWVKNNPYKYNPITSDNGNITGWNDWKAKELPVDDLNWDEQWGITGKLIADEKGQSSNEKGTTRWESLPPDKIRKFLETRFHDNNFDRAVYQDYQVTKNTIQDINDKLATLDTNSDEYNDLSQRKKQIEDQYLKAPNGQDITDYDGYYVHKLGTKYPEFMSYYNNYYTSNEPKIVEEKKNTDSGGSGFGVGTGGMLGWIGYGPSVVDATVVNSDIETPATFDEVANQTSTVRQYSDMINPSTPRQ